MRTAQARSEALVRHCSLFILANTNDSYYSEYMIVCLCHRVSDRDIAREAAAGCHSFETLQQELLVGTACGSCLDCAHETFHAYASGACQGCPGAQRCSSTGARLS
jgi:bacterioferritin-associated ferredoxin